MTSRQTPERIILNARIYTVDSAFSTQEALAVRDGRIVAVGSNDDIKALAGPGTRIEDLGGAVVLPGIIDSHNHLMMTSHLLRQIQLYDCRSIAEILDRVGERAKMAKPGEWIEGRGWDESLLAERRFPTRWELDRVAPNNPVVIHRVWNKLVANSAALAAAEITRETPDPPASERYAGSFDRDPETGEPNGLFRDRAKELVTAAVPKPTPEQLVEILAGGCHAYNAAGITGVAEPGLDDEQIAAYVTLRDRGGLTVRTHMLLAGWGFCPAEREPGLKDWILGYHETWNQDDDRLRLDGVKFMLDGGIGDRTARMGIPYVGEPDNVGQWVVDPEAYPQLVRWVHDLDYSIDTHTCGTEAQALTARSYASALSENPRPGIHHRLHHAYFPDDETMRLMAEFRIPALVSNPFIIHLGESFVDSVGEERASRVMPMASYLKAGIPLAGSSDSPVSDYHPFAGMYAAIARKTATGRQFDRSECISREDTVRSYTIGGAAALGVPSERGSLEPGKLADLIVLDRDPLTVDDDALNETQVQRTMVGGAWVWER